MTYVQYRKYKRKNKIDIYTTLIYYMHIRENLNMNYKINLKVKIKTTKEKIMYYTYMLRCADNSIYTGMTNDLEKRFNEHVTKGKNGAKYTKSHDVIRLEIAWKSKEKSLACKLEYQIKNLTKQQKENLIKGEKLNKYLKGKVDCRRYRRIDDTDVLLNCNK